MKNTMNTTRKTIVALFVALSLLLSLASASGITVGIQQFAEHPSLDNCYNGFLQGMEEQGFVEGDNLTVLYQNAQTDMGVATQIAQSYVSRDVDLLCGIATVSAQASYNAVLSAGKETPVIFTAVSAPIEAGLAYEDGSPVGNVTGTSDLLPFDKQLEMIRAMLPEAKKIGILYTSSETNSEVQAAIYQKLAPALGFEIVTGTVTSGAEIAQATQALLPQVDCITMLTDNTVVSYLPIVLDIATGMNIPVFGSEIEQVKNGCLASEGLDYVALGKQTGVMAGKILNGEDVQNLPYATLQESALYVNGEVAEMLGITIPQALTERATDVSK